MIWFHSLFSGSTLPLVQFSSTLLPQTTGSPVSVPPSLDMFEEKVPQIQAAHVDSFSAVVTAILSL